MRTALITLSDEGARVAGLLAEAMGEADVYVHEHVGAAFPGERFVGIAGLTAELFNRYRGLVYIAPSGAVVRAIAPCLRHKTTDPAVVVVDVCGRYAVSLLSGHEGGANDLAIAVANILAAEPVITTTSEARKDLIVGVGCRRCMSAERITAAVRAALTMIGADVSRVRLIATADVKADEAGLRDAARELGIPLRIIASEEIRSCRREFHHSDFVEEKVELPAVAEPAALLAGRRTQLVLEKTRFDGVTIAIARENCSW